MIVEKESHGMKGSPAKPRKTSDDAVTALEP